MTRALPLLFALLAGCVRTPLQLADSTSHLDGPGSYEVIGPVEGKACQFNLFYLIPLGGNQLWKAKERAIGDTDGLVDVSVDTHVGFAVIGYVSCTLVRGKTYRLAHRPSSFVEPQLIPDPTAPVAPPPPVKEVAPRVEPSEATDAPAAPAEVPAAGAPQE